MQDHVHGAWTSCVEVRGVKGIMTWGITDPTTPSWARLPAWNRCFKSSRKALKFRAVGILQRQPESTWRFPIGRKGGDSTNGNYTSGASETNTANHVDQTREIYFLNSGSLTIKVSAQSVPSVASLLSLLLAIVSTNL